MALEINANTVIINGQAVAIAKKPKYKRGSPKVNSNSAMVGNEVVISQSKDFSEAVGEVTIAVRATAENIELIESWQDSIGKNAIRMIDKDTGFTKTFNQMSVEEDAEIDFDSEEIEITFKGGRGV
jgi:hypothetical protein